ncbi:hypothetical protein [Bacillus anthracis]|uniref:hypothetical protein n=1 Tax=Bacillus anthracis TaxID=1392 RepID=UPI002DB81A28|nr:hypothetical protein [Bacillus anthracis]MEB9454410.1 hypothetical protein [Bacillus anthracis]
MDKTHRVGLLTEMLKDRIKKIEERSSIDVYKEVNDEFRMHIEYILTAEEFSHLTVADLKPLVDVLADFKDRYFKRFEA